MEVTNSMQDLRRQLLCGLVIPAHPLALTQQRSIDERHQRALTRYYIDSGVGGLAVGVHTTGFAIHQPSVALYRPVLELAISTAKESLQRRNVQDMVYVAGLVGDTKQAIDEAIIANDLGYNCGLLSLSAWRNSTASDILTHCKHVSEAIPLFGFYLQPAVGGMTLDYRFWREFAEIDNVVAVKIAPFSRYETLDAVRGIADSGRDDIALYTGNDDSIIADLVTPFPAFVNEHATTRRIVGGLLGQWAVWTKNAVATMNDIREWRHTDTSSVPSEWLAQGAALTAANQAIFDSANMFKGCLPGILEVLRRQGLVKETITFDENEVLSEGQSDAITRICEQHPWLTDNEFVAEHIDDWMR